MIMIPSLLIAVTLVTLWVAAWLHWVFVGSVRQFLFAKVFPRRWSESRSTRELLAMPSSAANPGYIGDFLMLESKAPSFVNGVLSCPGCLSAHLSAVGTVLAATLLPWEQVAESGPDMLAAISSLPLIWAAGAWIGHRLHARV